MYRTNHFAPICVILVQRLTNCNVLLWNQEACVFFNVFVHIWWILSVLLIFIRVCLKIAKKTTRFNQKAPKANKNTPKCGKTIKFKQKHKQLLNCMKKHQKHAKNTKIKKKTIRMKKNNKKLAKIMWLYKKHKTQLKNIKNHINVAKCCILSKKTCFCKNIIQNLQKRSGNLRGTFGEPSGNLRGIKIRSKSVLF